MRDAAAREQRDPVGAEEPRCALGRVPGVGVLGQEDQQAAAELLVQRREHERQRRLGDARATRQGLHERLEPLARGELGDEGVKGCRVHANGGERGPRGPSSARRGRSVAIRRQTGPPGHPVPHLAASVRRSATTGSRRALTGTLPCLAPRRDRLDLPTGRPIRTARLAGGPAQAREAVAGRDRLGEPNAAGVLAVAVERPDTASVEEALRLLEPVA